MSSLQPTRAETTRTAIIHALARVIATRGISEFSVQSVADEAGVSHRTVYRYYPSREALLEGLTEHLDEWMREQGLPGIPTTFEACIDAVPVIYDFFDSHSQLVEAMVVVSIALDVEPRRRRERTEGFVAMVAREAPHLENAEARRWALALRSLASSQQWYALTRRFGLDQEDATSVAVDSLRAVIAEIRRRNDRRADRGGDI